MNLKNLQGVEAVTRHSTARYEFYELETTILVENPDDPEGEKIPKVITPWIEVRPVGEVNRAYMNAVLARQSKNRRKLNKGKIDVKMLEENRDEDRDLYPKHVFTGNWGGWIDAESDDDREVPYSPEEAKSLLRQLPPEMFDELRAFCNDTANFRS